MQSSLFERLSAIPHVRIVRDALLSQYTRFGIGGPASLLAESADEHSFLAALKAVQASGSPWVVIGEGTNLVVADAGFEGIVLRFTGDGMEVNGKRIWVEAGAELQDLVDLSINHGLARIHSMTGIPGSVGAAVYGNAGAYGHSISESVREVRFFDGQDVNTFDNRHCEFAYRESIFKRRRQWVILSAELELEPSKAADLRHVSDDILRTRNAKYPPSMKCAGSIFKNLLFAELPAAVRAELPASVVREGKVPSAWFLEQVGAKGLRNGGIHVADYHANLIYNAGQGTAKELVETIGDLKSRVRGRFGFDLEEEVQYVGFNGSVS